MKEARKLAWLLGFGSILASILLVTQPEGLIPAMILGAASLVLLLASSTRPRTQRARAALVWAFMFYTVLAAAAFAARLLLHGLDSFAFLPVALAAGGVVGSILAFRTRKLSSRNYIRSYFTE